MMDRLLVILLGLAVIAVFIVFVLPVDPLPTDEDMADASITVEGATHNQYGIDQQSLIQLTQKARLTLPQTRINNPNASGPRVLRSPDASLNRSARQVPPAISIRHANGGTLSALSLTSSDLLHKTRAGVKLTAPQSSVVAQTRQPKHGIQSAVTQVQFHPVVSGSDGARLYRLSSPTLANED